MRQEPYPIEPDLLAIGKLFIASRLAYQVVFIILSLPLPGTPLLGSSLFYLGLFAFIFLYLSSDFLRLRLGRYYLPIALVVTTMGIVLDRPLYAWYTADLYQATGATAFTALAEHLPRGVLNTISSDVGWSAMLFVPLVLVAWQYGFRKVILYIVMTMVIRLIAQPLVFGSASTDLTNIGPSLIGRIIAFVIVGYVVSRLASALRQERDALRQANIQLADHVATLDQLATSRERNRLARELHDTMAHSLSATAVQLEATQALWDTNNLKARQLVQRSLETTRSGLTETRRALEALRASPLEDMGLQLALEELAKSASERAGFELDMQLPTHIYPMPAALEQTVYRCAQETLANIVKHAAAQHVMISLTQDPQHLTLEIQDDGQGFDLTGVDQDRHFGLLGMRERVELLGGCVEIVSQQGQGTAIKVEMNP